MISVLKQGHYRLYESKGQTKMLSLDTGEVFAWVNAEGIGEILVTSDKEHEIDCVLAEGKFWLYNVEAEPKLSDQQHLELQVGRDSWQGYLLPTGLPTHSDKRNRVIPTKEIITP